MTDRLVKTVKMGKVGGHQEDGVPVLTNDITEWCNCTFPKAVRLAESRYEWRKGINDMIGLNSTVDTINTQ